MLNTLYTAGILMLFVIALLGGLCLIALVLICRHQWVYRKYKDDLRPKTEAEIAKAIERLERDRHRFERG